MSETDTIDYERVLEVLNSIDDVNAHTNGGGVDNDIVASMNGVSRLDSETMKEVYECGFRVLSVGTGNHPKLVSDGVVCFTERDTTDTDKEINQ